MTTYNCQNLAILRLSPSFLEERRPNLITNKSNYSFVSPGKTASSVSRPVMCLSESEKQIVSGIIITSHVSHTPTLSRLHFILFWHFAMILSLFQITPRKTLSWALWDSVQIKIENVLQRSAGQMSN